MQAAEQLHVLQVDEMTRAFNSSHIKTICAELDLSVILNRHGVYENSSTKLRKSRKMFNQVSRKLRSSNGDAHTMVTFWKASLDFQWTEDPLQHSSPDKQDEQTNEGLLNSLLEICTKGDPCVVAQCERLARLKLSMGRLMAARILIIDTIDNFSHRRNTILQLEIDKHPRMISLLEAKAKSLRLDNNHRQAMSTMKYVVSLAEKTFPNGDEHARTKRYRETLSALVQEVEPNGNEALGV